jgi:hypothetical protein
MQEEDPSVRPAYVQYICTLYLHLRSCSTLRSVSRSENLTSPRSVFGYQSGVGHIVRVFAIRHILSGITRRLRRALGGVYGQDRGLCFRSGVPSAGRAQRLANSLGTGNEQSQ